MEWAVRQPPAREGINAPYARNISWTLLSGEGFTPAPGTGPACMGLGHQRLRERQGRGPGVRVGAQLLDLGSLHVGRAGRRWADSTTGAASLCPTRCMGSGQDGHTWRPQRLHCCVKAEGLCAVSFGRVFFLFFIYSPTWQKMAGSTGAVSASDPEGSGCWHSGPRA